MSEFVQLWVYLSSTPLFGLTATLVVYLLAQAFYARMQQAPWANPVLWSVLALAAGLAWSGTAYPSYFSGAQFIHFCSGPRWWHWPGRCGCAGCSLRQRWGRFAIASLVGGTAAAGQCGGAGLGAGPAAGGAAAQLVPKSVTAPVAMGVAEAIGGIPALAAVFAVATGMVGALFGRVPVRCRWALGATPPAGWRAASRWARRPMALALRGALQVQPRCRCLGRAGAGPAGAVCLGAHSLAGALALDACNTAAPCPPDGSLKVA